MSTKPEWWKKENEKMPGNPLSRSDLIWNDTPDYVTDPRSRVRNCEKLICELLAVIDRQSEEAKERETHIAECHDRLFKCGEAIEASIHRLRVHRWYADLKKMKTAKAATDKDDLWGGSG